ncbi:flavodoxin [Cellulosilyticum sp. WCF-2]|uniref:flavodoxin n=1 Tax=Cellulosilyticum sp. WCF-2 TaxID=2497860 RepID=UPI000F8DEBDC|nr:flavodoxin [Cellulosilyticum sp. WCF-2]QEH70482.1 flavodoxin [Cellulosilyticum sp. WCF-2]
MSKKLVAYFSASGVTERVAKRLAEAAEADLYEIKPEVPYTNADLNWNDKKSRSSVEMNNPLSRPAIATNVENMEQYDTVFVGFPIWWYVAPTIINTFLESYDFAGKNIVLFATSGGSGLGNSQKMLEVSVTPTTKFIPGKKLSSNAQISELAAWVKGLNL